MKGAVFKRETETVGEGQWGAVGQTDELRKTEGQMRG